MQSKIYIYRADLKFFKAEEDFSSADFGEI